MPRVVLSILRAFGSFAEDRILRGRCSHFFHFANEDWRLQRLRKQPKVTVLKGTKLGLEPRPIWVPTAVILHPFPMKATGRRPAHTSTPSHQLKKQVPQNQSGHSDLGPPAMDSPALAWSLRRQLPQLSTQPEFSGSPPSLGNLRFPTQQPFLEEAHPNTGTHQRLEHAVTFRPWQADLSLPGSGWGRQAKACVCLRISAERHPGHYPQPCPKLLRQPWLPDHRTLPHAASTPATAGPRPEPLVLSLAAFHQRSPGPSGLEEEKGPILRHPCCVVVQKTSHSSALPPSHLALIA